MAKRSNLPRRKRAPASRGAAPQTAHASLREEFRRFARVAILQAGEEVLANHGLHSARMEEVAEKARVAVGTIYNLIGDRDALVAEIMRKRHEAILQLLTASLEEGRALTFGEQAQACVAAMFSYFREHRRFFQLVLESERGPACAHKRVSQETFAQIRSIFRELIARGVRQRALRSDNRELLPALLMGMVREVIMLELETPQTSSPEERAAQIVSLFVDGAGIS
jgi:AcrR family transcriptional regulator